MLETCFDNHLASIAPSDDWSFCAIFLLIRNMNWLLSICVCVVVDRCKLNYFFFICLLVSQAIFAREKIEDVIPLAPNAILILGQGNPWISLFKLFCRQEVL